MHNETAAALFLLFTNSAIAQDAPVRLQCQVSAQEAGSSQSRPFSIEISGKAVTLSGVSALESNFSLMRKNDAFYVFKNNKNQAGNINRSNDAVEPYAVNPSTHKNDGIHQRHLRASVVGFAL